MQNPKISVVMSVYNGERYLRQSVESILKQTFDDFEFIIIDDGSTDNASGILEEYQKSDSRIRLLRQENMGLTRSLNRGINLAKGEYIARMDSDDISTPERLAKEVGFLDENTEFVLVGSWADVIDDGGASKIVWKSPHYPASDLMCRWRLLFNNCFMHSSVMFRREAVLKLGGYDENLRQGQDYDLWVKMAAAGKIANLPLMLTKLRKFHADNIGSRYEKETDRIREKVASGYAGRLIGNFDHDSHLLFIDQVIRNDLSLMQVKSVVGLAGDIMKKFFLQNTADKTSQGEIRNELAVWFGRWALNNKRHPYKFCFLIKSMLKVKLLLSAGASPAAKRLF